MARSIVATCLITAAVAVIALATAAAAQARNIEGELNQLHHRCERGDQHACIAFGQLLEANRDRHRDWQHRHPEYWSGGPAPKPPVRVVEPVTPQFLKRLHRECERGNRNACHDYRHALESNPQFHDEWRRNHPEFWTWLKN